MTGVQPRGRSPLRPPRRPAPATPSCSYQSTDTSAPGGFTVAEVSGALYRIGSGAWGSDRSWSGLGAGTYHGSVYRPGATQSDGYNTSAVGPASGVSACGPVYVSPPSAPAGCAQGGSATVLGGSFSAYGRVCSSITDSWVVTSSPATQPQYLHADWQVRYRNRGSGSMTAWQSLGPGTYYPASNAAGVVLSGSYQDQYSGVQFRVSFTSYWGDTGGWGTTGIVTVPLP